MVETTGVRARQMDLGHACAARICDAFLGGSHNFGIERDFVDQAEHALPGITGLYQENRAFLRRAAEHLLSLGVRQFLDLGSGIPTIGHIHDVVRRRRNDYRILYVDNEPLTVAHSKPLLANDPRVDIIEADCREPDQVLSAPELRRLFDPNQPVALFMLSVLQFLTESDGPDELVATYRARLLPGSYLALSHITDAAQPAQARMLEDLYARSTDPLTARQQQRIDRWFGDFKILEPGLGFVRQWRPDPGKETASPYRLLYGGVGQKLAAPAPRMGS